MPELPSDFDPVKGAVLLIDKPLGWTSFDVVNKIRYALGRIKVGHAGTLDPMATGLLVVCTGAMTKQVDTFQAQHKTYWAELTLGATTPSYDIETPTENHKPFEGIDILDFEKVMNSFLGKIAQIPPPYSAALVNGKRAYQIARSGGTPELKPKTIEIFSLELMTFEPPKITINIRCSKGTYVRSLAHDIGQRLGCGAYLSALRRIQSGEFHVDDAWKVNELSSALKALKAHKTKTASQNLVKPKITS